MLILNRNVGNKIYIGNDVLLTVTKITTDRHGDPVVFLGFDAPEHVSIDREEVRIRRIKSVDAAFNVPDQ